MNTEGLHEMVALNADVVGYSALVADDVATTTATMTEYRQLVDERVAANGGALANFVGDSFMAVFDDAMAGLRSAISITTAVEKHNEDLPSHRRVRFRMGMELLRWRHSICG